MGSDGTTGEAVSACLFSAGFLTLFVRLLVPGTISVFSKVLMILEMRNVSTRVLYKASHGSTVHGRASLFERHDSALLVAADRPAP